MLSKKIRAALQAQLCLRPGKHGPNREQGLGKALLPRGWGHQQAFGNCYTKKHRTVNLRRAHTQRLSKLHQTPRGWSTFCKGAEVDAGILAHQVALGEGLGRTRQDLVQRKADIRFERWFVRPDHLYDLAVRKDTLNRAQTARIQQSLRTMLHGLEARKDPRPRSAYLLMIPSERTPRREP